MSPTSTLSSSQDLAAAIVDAYPPLGRYCPHIHRISVPQAVFLLNDGRESVYGGAAGGGKSDALLMAALMYADVPGYSALILRRTFPELQGSDGLLARALSWLSNTDAKWNEQKRAWTFPSGSTLRFGHVETEADRFKYDGQAYQFVGFDELTSFTEIQYDHIGFTRTRRSEELAVPTRTRGSCTPTGAGYGWVRRRFITHRHDDVLFVPAKVRDNPGIDFEDYELSFAHVPEMLRRRLLEGDWDTFEGAAYPDFDERVHVVEPFNPPEGWERFEQMDFGINNPTAWHPVAVDYDGNLFVFDEYYKPGLVTDHAAEVKKRREWWWPQVEDGWGRKPVTFADPSVRHRTGGQSLIGDPATIVTEFADHGIALSAGNNDPRAGFSRVSELLRVEPGRVRPSWAQQLAAPQENAGAPRLYISRSCEHLIEQLKTAPIRPMDERDGGEMVDPKWESQHGHAHAALRYGVMSRPSPSVKPPEEIEDPREAHARKWLAQKSAESSYRDL